MYKLYSDTASLGDNLDMTALLNYAHCELYLPDVPQCHEQAPIFWGLTNSINFYQPPFHHNPEPQILAQKCFRILKAHGLEKRVSAFPIIYLKQSEIDWAINFLFQYRDGEDSLCVIKPYSKDGCIRTPTKECIEKVLSCAKVKKLKFLNFGHSKFNNHVSLPGVPDIMDLPIRHLAACYAVIGKYIGADTGDYHLMLATGGTCQVLVPTSCPQYNWDYFCYKESTLNRLGGKVEYLDYNLFDPCQLIF